MRKIALLIIWLLLLSACSAKHQTVSETKGAGIVKKPASEDIRPGEKINMMLMMETEDINDEMEDIVIIPPDEVKRKKAQSE